MGVKGRAKKKPRPVPGWLSDPLELFGDPDDIVRREAMHAANLDRCLRIFERSRMVCSSAKEVAARELLACLDESDRYSDLSRHRTLNAKEAAAKAANHRNVQKLLELLGVEEKRDADEEDVGFD